MVTRPSLRTLESLLAPRKSSMEVSAVSPGDDPRIQLTCETLATYYITKPGADAPDTNGAAVLYLTDVFGINLTENKL